MSNHSLIIPQLISKCSSRLNHPNYLFIFLTCQPAILVITILQRILKIFLLLAIQSNKRNANYLVDQI